MMTINTGLLDKIADVAIMAGDLIMGVYNRGGAISQKIKEDRSPLTEADLLAHHCIIEALTKIRPELPIISEESDLPDYELRQKWPCYWLIDPLDGTKEFIARNGEFTVNIALIIKGQAVLGVVFAPALRRLYQAINSQSDQKFAERIDLDHADNKKISRSLLKVKGLETQIKNHNMIRLVSSRHHGVDKANDLHRKLSKEFCPVSNQALGSSLKLCLIAEGKADLYPRLGPTSEWDIAAAQAILEAAGGAVLDAQLQPLTYNNKQSMLNPEFFACGDKPIACSSIVSKYLLTVSQYIHSNT